jgi:hypothetical protein
LAVISYPLAVISCKMHLSLTNRQLTTGNCLIMRGRQALAPFGAAALEDKLTALRAHADAEAVRLGAAAIVWLKSSLRHTLHLSINVSTEKGKPIECGGQLSSFRQAR